MLFASARERDLIPRAKQEVRMALRESQGRLEGKRDAFLVEDLGEMAATVDNVLLGISLLLGAIGAISLLVGGIGIMNIMLVSVTERTREIGLRMAVGATGGDVLAQFLVEASVLSCTGGLVGMALGAGVAVAASKVLTALSGLDWPAVVSPGSLLLAFCFSVGVGVFFGFYPAWRASRMDPIEALRHE
jgi:putative ABC transport system permease protein